MDYHSQFSNPCHSFSSKILGVIRYLIPADRPPLFSQPEAPNIPIQPYSGYFVVGGSLVAVALPKCSASYITIEFSTISKLEDCTFSTN
jgi:hypothetical protein